MNAEIIAIGTELLLGEISDTNSAHIAKHLRELGLDLWWISAVGDNEARIAELVDQARRRSAIVITSGGLGPTVDDPTRAAIARAFGLALEFRPELWAQIEARFVRYGRKATENNRKQAYVPAGAIALENPVGTAPCFIVEHPDGAVISLPGVPRELEYMLEHAVLPYLRQRITLPAVIRSRTLRTVGIGESLIDAKIGDLEELSNPTVGLAAHPGQTDVRITAKAATGDEAEALLQPLEADLRRRLGDFIYATGQVEVEEVVANLLADKGQTPAWARPAPPAMWRCAWRECRMPRRCSRAALWRQRPLRPPRTWLPPPGNQPIGAWACALDLNADPPLLEIALAGAQGVETQTLGFGGHPGLAVRWVGTAALNLLRLKLMRE